MDETEDMGAEVDNIRFNALRNALYHTARRLTLERWDRWFNFLVILLGASAVAKFFPAGGRLDSAIGVGVAAVGALQLVFGFGRSARDHQGFQRQYYELLAEIEENPGADARQCSVWRGKMSRIAGEEPPFLRAVDAKAYNDALDSLEIDASQRLHIPLRQRIFGTFYPFEGHRYEKMIERDARIAALPER